MKGKTTLLAGASLLAIAMYSQSAVADGSRVKPSYEELENRIEDLEQRLDEKEEADRAAKLRTRVSNLEERADAVQWSFENLRPTVKTGDNRFSMSIRGRFQADWATYWQDELPDPTAPGVAFGLPLTSTERDLSGGAVVRRARLGVEGKAFNDFWYELRFDFGGSGTESNGLLNLARIAYNVGGDPDWRLNVGIMQPVFTYQNAVSSADLIFVERPSIVNIMVDNFGGDSARRAIELTYQHTDLFWKGDNLVVTGAYSGQRIGQTDTRDESTHALGRIAWRLWSDGISNFQVGGSAAQILDIQGTPAHTLAFSERPESRVDGQSLISTGFAQDGNAMAAEGGWMYGFEGGLNIENWYIGGEYYTFGIDRDFFFSSGANVEPEFDGWYIESSYVLIGGPKTYAARSNSNNYAVWGQPRIQSNFGWGDAIGALELAVRYSTVDLNFNEGVVGGAIPEGGVRGGEQEIWTVGLNWYLNPNMRAIFDYQDVSIEKFEDGSPAAGADANAFAGQDFSAAIGRVQFTF